MLTRPRKKPSDRIMLRTAGGGKRKAKGKPGRPVDPIVSYRMSKIRSRDTSIELVLRRALARRGLRFRKHYTAVPGCPDVAFPRLRVAVFCDSEFWHGRDWPILRRRLTPFWVDKISRNRRRDRLVDAKLAKAGWTVLRFWDVEINFAQARCVEKIVKALVRAEKQIYCSHP